jgi:hypothetical protein
MSFQVTELFHCTVRRQWLLVGLAVVCAASGCWREVEYTAPETAAGVEKPAQVTTDQAAGTTEPSPTVADVSKSEPDSKAAAGEFGDDLAATLTEKDSAARPSEPAATTPITDSSPPPSSDVGDRYANKTSDVTPPANPPESATAPPATNSSVESLLAEPVDPNAPPNSPVNDSMLPEQREAIAESSDAPIPNLNDDEIQTPPAVQNWNTRRAAWLLGSKLSLAALANEHGAPADQVQKLFGQSNALAKKLNIPLKALPARPAPAAARPANDAALDYLFSEGQEVGSALAKGQGADHAALFEVAVKSNILLALYKPDSPTTQAIAAAIERAGERAKLPSTLWQPLLDALAAKSTLVDVRKAVYSLHDATDKYLDETKPR